MENKEDIYIHPGFIKSSMKRFISDYELNLARYMRQWTLSKYEDFISIDPKYIVEIEKEFIKNTVDLLKKRRTLNQNLFRKVYESFLKENNLTEEVFIEKYNDGICEKYSTYQYEQIPSEIINEDTSFTMKVQFLMVKANKINCIIDLKDDFRFEEISTIPNEETIDLSRTKATEKIVILKELGIIDLLRNQEPFKYSINKLAAVLSAITDENRTTLQPMLNSMLSVTNSPEKNPYNSKKTVSKVKNKLIELGYEFKDAVSSK